MADPRTATTLAYARASQRVSSRLSNLFHHIWPDMIGVWLMGEDRSDLERQQFGIAQGVGGIIAQLSAVALTGPSETEVESLWLRSDVAIQVGVFTDDSNGVATWGSITAPVFAFGLPPPIRGGSTPRVAISGAYGGGLDDVRFAFALTPNVPLQVLSRPFVLPANRRLVVQALTLNSTIHVATIVRSRDL